MADYSYGSYDFSPESDYYSQTPDQYSPDVQNWMQAAGGMGGGVDLGYQNWSDWFQQPQTPQYEAPSYTGMSDALRSAGTPDYSSTPGGEVANPAQSIASTMPPNIGGPGGAGTKEDDWLKQLGKAGLGMGVGVGSQVLGGLFQNAMAPKQQQPQQAALAPLPPAPSAATYTPEPLAPLPGTKASPLISGRPTSVKLSPGLKEKNPGYGGFAMY